MTVAVLCGLLLCGGLWAVARGLFPAPEPLARRIGRYHDTTVGSTGGGQVDGGWERFSLRVFEAVHGDVDRVRPDLAVTGTSVSEHVTDKVKAGLLGATIVAGWLFALGARSLPFVAVTGVVGFVGFFLYPDVDLRKKAAARRREFVDAVTAFVGLVSVSIAGGGGVTSAMNAAAHMGDGWAFEQLRFALDRAITRNESPWSSLDQLGVELGVPELVELGASMSLAGQSGARVSDSLAARARSARAKEISERLAEEERKSESLGLPVVVMLLGWMGFLGYPAVVNIIGL